MLTQQAEAAALKTQSSPVSVVQSSVNNKTTVDKAAKPKPSLVGPLPASQQFMQPPSPSNFTIVQSKTGKYSISLPKNWGSNPLADKTGLDDALLLRIHDNSLMLAVNYIDHTDTLHYKPKQALPGYPNKKVLWSWQQNSTPKILWNCQLSRVNDYHGDRMLLQADTKVNGIAYEALYVMPMSAYALYLPSALYSLSSFAL